MTTPPRLPPPALARQVLTAGLRPVWRRRRRAERRSPVTGRAGPGGGGFRLPGRRCSVLPGSGVAAVLGDLCADGGVLGSCPG
ncbi:hypothetical protein HBB16_10850 [Pseudonocardia sp. MCCB 268]|nr:hypothetical protein [Pseudonocardia cytotoxica]